MRNIHESNYPHQALLPARWVRERYRISGRTLSRWLRAPALSFPTPLVINGRRYFDEASLIEWERTRAAEQPSARA